MSIFVYCVRMEPVDNQVVCRNLDILNEVYFMGVTPKALKKGQKLQHPPGIPMFVTKEATGVATYFQLHNVETYSHALLKHGFDLFHPSYLVNVNLVDRIEVGLYGNDAYFKGGGELSVPVSRSKTNEYEYLVVKRSAKPNLGF